MIDEYGNDMDVAIDRVSAGDRARSVAISTTPAPPSAIVMPDAAVPRGIMDEFSRRPPAAATAMDTPAMAAYRNLSPMAQARIMGNRTVEDKQQWVRDSVGRSQDAYDRHQAMKTALGEAFFQHVVAPYFSATGAVGAAGERSRGQIGMAREQGEQSIRRQEVANQGQLAAEQERGRSNALQESMRAAPALMKLIFGEAPYQSAGNGTVFNTRTGAVDRPDVVQPTMRERVSPDGKYVLGYESTDARGIKFTPLSSQYQIQNGTQASAAAPVEAPAAAARGDQFKTKDDMLKAYRSGLIDRNTASMLARRFDAQAKSTM